MPATDIVIVSATRTAVGSFSGAFANTSAHELGAAAVKSAIALAKIEAAEVDEVILGQILSGGQGQNPARQAAMKAGVPQEKTAFGLNQLCGSGLRAVALGLQQIGNGDANIVVAGGQESMSQAQHGAYLRSGVKMGGVETGRHDAEGWPIDAFHGYHMGNTAENIAEMQISREDQDHSRCFAEQGGRRAEGGALQGRSPLHRRLPQATVVADDEYIRHGATYDLSAFEARFRRTVR